MRRLVVIIMAVLVVTAGRASANEVADSLFARANALFDGGRFADAADAYRSITDAGFDSPALDYNLGLALREIGQSGESLYHLTRAARDPAFRDPASRLAEEVRQEWMLPADATATPSGHGFFWWWLVGTGMAAVGVVVALIIPHRSQKWVRGAVIVGIVLTLAAPLASALRTSGDSAMIVSGPAPAYETFDGLSPAGSPAREGQLVTLVQRRGARTLVRIQDGRSAWLDSHRVREF